jgi:NADP-dependent 3-hydroxy acid dehydrogenase YdfG
MSDRLIVCISGASAGIGAAVAAALAGEGFGLMLGARRADRVKHVADELAAKYGVPVWSGSLDVTDPASVDAFVSGGVAALGGIDVLVNNAGVARGLDRIENVAPGSWRQMLDTNVEGVLRMTQAVLPHIRKSGRGHIVNISSIAGQGVYVGGGVYCATKHALDALTGTLRLELLGEPIRVSSIDPGMVETEFSIVRLGDVDKAAGVYRDMTPLTAADIAECVRWVVMLPEHINIDRITVKPRDQGDLRTVHRRPK